MGKKKMKAKSDEDLLQDFADWTVDIVNVAGMQFSGGSQMIEAYNKIRDEILERMKK
jgi:hypothetical protein